MQQVTRREIQSDMHIAPATLPLGTLTNGFVHDPVCDRLDVTRLFSEWNELHRCDEAALRMNPAHQGFDMHLIADAKGIYGDVRQGSFAGRQPVVSPNSGQLHTIGALGIDGVVDAHFDISAVTNAALTAVITSSEARPTLYRIDLSSGKTESIGIIGAGDGLLGITIVP